ncbi:DNA-binding transcriptional regulator, LysR family [Agrococcus baldri]|uniref:DNA-binding transcriptional regulator, LysR family n=1 Tax=Agrococcus baldri TaxID=153730 RepID=A0AA94HMV4_9MICO|nr:LysR family transcriptional regulator [Agrococcus baldri]SFS12100.1 DNA-binding transcriptional regulator, LysR family [Agrococcus baldri]
MMAPRALELFLAVLDHGSVSAAADEAFLTQPTVSRQIAALEREVGARLFRRTTAGMRPTAAGERLEPLARDLVRRSRRAAAAMADHAAGQSVFTVACPETTGNFFVAPFIAAGGAVADIQPAAPADVYGLLRLSADIAINTSPPPAMLRGVELARARIRCHVPPPHPLADRASVELEELAAGPLLVPGFGSAVERTVRHAAEVAGFAIEHAAMTSNATIAQARAAAGHGAALLIEPAAFGLVHVPLRHRGEPLAVTLHAGWERGHYASASIAALAEQMAAFMRLRLEQEHMGEALGDDG